MCGIIGYVGNENCRSKVLKGLKNLEYRGYDSAGIALGNNGEAEVFRTTKLIDDLVNTVKKDSNLIIGHTRWSTHGKPSIANAHPHTSYDGRFTLVHNGVIVNYEELKIDYLKGVTYKSETDSEVLVHLLAKLVECGLDIKDAIAKFMVIVKGSFALAILDAEQKDVMYCVKRNSPLIIGTSKEFNFIASDAGAIIDEVKDFIELQDNEFAILKPNGVELYDLKKKEIKRDSIKIDVDNFEISKGDYEHFMMKEVDEQPDVIRNIADKYITDDYVFANDLLKEINNADEIIILAAGTSYNSGLIAKEYFEKISGKKTSVLVASEFAYNTPLLSKKPVFIMVSQSGETADLIACYNLIKDKHKVITITNSKSSTLDRVASHTLLTFAGREVSVASTKAYVAQVTLMYILANALKNTDYKIVKKDLLDAATKIDKVLTMKDDIKTKISKLYSNKSTSSFYLGRGIDYSLAIEASLKLKELSYIHVEGFAAGELKHGTISLIEDNFPIIVLITQAHTSDNMRNNIKEVQARGAKTFVITTDELTKDGDDIVIPSASSFIQPLIAIIPTQLISYYVALQLGRNIDMPRNLAKSVTVE